MYVTKESDPKSSIAESNLSFAKNAVQKVEIA